MRTIVVGGVATGMSAAARLRRLDEHSEIIVLEKGSFVSYANCGLPYYVGGEIQDESSLLVQTPEKLHAALNLDVRVGHEVVAIDPASKTVTAEHDGKQEVLSYDNLVLAPGATAIKPNVPGCDTPAVWHLRTVPDAVEIRRRIEEGTVKRAVVLGAGFIGLEAAEALAEQDVDVTVVERADNVLPAADAEIAAHVTIELRRLGIHPVTGVAAARIDSTQDGTQVVLTDGRTLPADLVILSVGVRPASEPFVAAGVKAERGAILVDKRGRTNIESIWAGGDVVASTDPLTGALHHVPLAGPANRAGRLIADDIARSNGINVDDRRIAEPLSTAVVRVGTITVAMTGASRRALETAGIDHHTINLHPFSHATYFPGATQIHLVVHFSKKDGTLLGAQAVGESGADKRIDVIATAMRGGLTVEDLIDLDLAYSPPYGSAKDAVNMVGYYGQDVMDGITNLWYAQEIEEVMESALILDVRSPAEYATGHFEGALNIPHTELRDRLEEVREAAAGRPLRVQCQSGMRSYLAERILVQNGFEDVRNLSGGMLTMRAAIEGGLAPKIRIVR